MASLNSSRNDGERVFWDEAASEADLLMAQRSKTCRLMKLHVTADMVAIVLLKAKFAFQPFAARPTPYQHRLAFGGGLEQGWRCDPCLISEVKEERSTLPVNKVAASWQFPPSGGDPRGWVITIAHLVYLPAEAVDLAHAVTMPRKSFFSMSISKVPVFAWWRTFSVWTAFWLLPDTQESIKRDSGAFGTGIQPSLSVRGALSMFTSKTGVGQSDQSWRPIVSQLPRKIRRIPRRSGCQAGT